MGMLRLLTVTTATAVAIPTTTGYMTLTATAGITRNAVLYVSWAGGGMAVKVKRVIDSTHLTAYNLDPAPPGNKHDDLSSIPTAAVVYMPEQYVDDVDQADAPITIAFPTRTT
jgi:hypothetical protein